MNRIRTIQGAADELRKRDPGCAISAHNIRQLVLHKEIPSRKSTLARYPDMLDLWQESGYLFTNEYGGPMNPDNITQYLNRMGDRLQKENPNFPHLNPPRLPP